MNSSLLEPGLFAMRNDLSKDPTRYATALLATTFVVLLGMSTCGAIILIFAKSPREPFMICGGVVLFIGLVVWLLRDRPENQSRHSNFFWMMRHKPPEAPNYVPRRRSHRRNGHAPNRPPTVDEVREMSQNVKTWVPTGRLPRR